MNKLEQLKELKSKIEKSIELYEKYEGTELVKMTGLLDSDDPIESKEVTILVPKIQLPIRYTKVPKTIPFIEEYLPTGVKELINDNNLRSLIRHNEEFIVDILDREVFDIITIYEDNYEVKYLDYDENNEDHIKLIGGDNEIICKIINTSSVPDLDYRNFIEGQKDLQNKLVVISKSELLTTKDFLNEVIEELVEYLQFKLDESYRSN